MSYIDPSDLLKSNERGNQDGPVRRNCRQSSQGDAVILLLSYLVRQTASFSSGELLRFDTTHLPRLLCLPAYRCPDDGRERGTFTCITRVSLLPSDRDMVCLQSMIRDPRLRVCEPAEGCPGDPSSPTSNDSTFRARSNPKSGKT